MLSGPTREGLAVLQGLLLCGHCGRAITVRYTGNGGIYPMYLCNWLHREGLTTKDFLSFRYDVLDSVIAEELLNALQRAELELALEALQELEARSGRSCANGRCDWNVPSTKPHLPSGGIRKSIVSTPAVGFSH